MRRSASPLFLVLPLAAVLALPLAGCGDDAEETDDSQAALTSARTDSGSDRERTPRQVPPRIQMPKLPDAPPLTDAEAERVLSSVMGGLEASEASRNTLLYLVELKNKAALDAIRDELLAQTDGEYDDPDAAALGLEMLLASGDQSVASTALDLARVLIDEEEEVPHLAAALSRIEGARRGDAERLLAQLTISFDDEVAMMALETLAKRRSPAAAEHLADIAGDAENDDMVRATAVVAMLMTNDARAGEAADALVDGDASGWEIIDGFAVDGATDAVPYIKRSVAKALAEGNAEFEFTAACNSLVEIYRSGPGAADARALIEGWLVKDPDLDPDAATYALWVLGDNDQTAAAAALLATEVIIAMKGDGEMAVDLLNEVARRGLARDPRFRKAVDAAAAMEDREGLPGRDLTTQSLRAAAAHAYLRSR